MSAYIFGAICPEKDKGAGFVTTFADTEAMQLHLNEISKDVEKDKHAAVIMDKAGWHTDKELNVPKNITLIFLPPYSPELNPQERPWDHMRQKSLSNRTFDNLEEIVDACCDAWNEFVSVPKRIKNMCSRKWANLSI